MSAPTLIKKYGNRRLYDTGESRYITLDELSRKIRAGIDVRVVDAKSGEDLTQATLTQIIIEGRGAARMLPVPLLMQLIRMGDDVLAEFFGRYLSDALAMYLEMKRGASAVARYNPFAAMPFAASDAFARMWLGGSYGPSRAAQPPPSPSSPPSPSAPWDANQTETTGDEPEGAPPKHPPGYGWSNPEQQRNDELAQLRRELEALKQSVLERNQGGGSDADDVEASPEASADAGADRASDAGDEPAPTRKRKRSSKRKPE